MFNKKYVILFICLAFFLAPKIYYILKSYNTGNYTIENVLKGSDDKHYMLIGQNIRAYGVYSDNNSSKPTESATWRPPVWPFILSIFYLSTNNVFGIILLKFFLELILILLAFKIVINNSRIKNLYLISLFLILLEPQYIKYSITFLSESLTAVFILLLSIYFIYHVNSKNKSIFIILSSVVVILCHPVGVFFVLTLLIFYGLLNIKQNTKQVIFSGVLFTILMFLWPIRNYHTFKKELYITASQGAVFSKGWNKLVAKNFNNVNGDLADENLNFNDFSPEIVNFKNLSTLDLSKLYKLSSIKFINSLSFNEKLAISFTKLKANFNPFPMLKKDTFIDQLAIPFRILYIFIFLQAFYLLLKGKRKIGTEKYNSCLVIVAIIVGQSLMSVYAFTGLRFNSIYGMSILFIGILFNYEFLIALFDSKFKNIPA